MNYLREYMRFMEFAADERLTGSERNLWNALMYVFNRHAQGRVWPEGFIRIPNETLYVYGAMKFDTLASARNKLKQRGLIDFIPGKGSEKGAARAVNPLYKMVYFCPEYDGETAPEGDGVPVFPDGRGDGRGDGRRDGRGDGRGDIPININSKPKPGDKPLGEEDISTTDEHQDGRRYPERKKPLAGWELATWENLARYIDRNEEVQRVFGEAGMRVLKEILSSDRFSMELVGYALELTMKRNGKYSTPLGSPIGYMEALLIDWEGQGYKTIEDIREAKES